MAIDKNKYVYGDKVRFKWDLGYGSPGVMMVMRESRDFGRFIEEEGKEISRKDRKLIGMRCMWFNSFGEVCEGTFNTKDLVKLTGGELAKAELSSIPDNSLSTFKKPRKRIPTIKSEGSSK